MTITPMLNFMIRSAIIRPFLFTVGLFMSRNLSYLPPVLRTLSMYFAIDTYMVLMSSLVWASTYTYGIWRNIPSGVVWIISFGYSLSMKPTVFVFPLPDIPMRAIAVFVSSPMISSWEKQRSTSFPSSTAFSLRLHRCGHLRRYDDSIIRRNLSFVSLSYGMGKRTSSLRCPISLILMSYGVSGPDGDFFSPDVHIVLSKGFHS